MVKEEGLNNNDLEGLRFKDFFWKDKSCFYK